MASTDIDGSVIVILSKDEARQVYNYLCAHAAGDGLTVLEHRLAAKISRDLNLPSLE